MTKYHAVPVTIYGVRFDSKAEGRRYSELFLLAQAGEITDLKVHPRFVIWSTNGGKRRQDKIEYVGDFQYAEAGKFIVEDVKGVETAVFRLKEKMFRAMYPDIYLRVIKG